MSWVCPKSGAAVKSDSHRHAIFRCSPCSATTIPPVMSFSPAVFRQAPPRIVSRTPPLETKLTAQFHVKDVAHLPHWASLARKGRRGLQDPSQVQLNEVQKPLQPWKPYASMFPVIMKVGCCPSTFAGVAEPMG